MEARIPREEGRLKRGLADAFSDVDQRAPRVGELGVRPGAAFGQGLDDLEVQRKGLLGRLFGS